MTKRYTIGVEAIVYDEIYIEADSIEEAEELAHLELKSEHYDHYTLDIEEGEK